MKVPPSVTPPLPVFVMRPAPETFPPTVSVLALELFQVWFWLATTFTLIVCAAAPLATLIPTLPAPAAASVKVFPAPIVLALLVAV